MIRFGYAEHRVNKYMRVKYVMKYIVTRVSFVTNLDSVLLKGPQYDNFWM